MTNDSPRTSLLRTKTLWSVFGASALALTLGGSALAGSPSASHASKGQHRGKLERFCKKAECTESQKTELQGVMKEFRTDTKSDHAKLKELHQKLAAEFAKDKPNERTMKALYRQAEQIQRTMTDRRHDMFMEVHGLLNAEQRKMAAKFLLRRGGHHRGGPHGKGHGKKHGQGSGQNRR